MSEFTKSEYFTCSTRQKNHFLCLHFGSPTFASIVWRTLLCGFKKTFTDILKNGKIYFLHVQKKEQDSSLYGQQHF